MASFSVTMSRSVTSSGVSQSDPLWHLLLSRYSWSDAGNLAIFPFVRNNVCLAIVDCDIDDEWPLVWYCWLGCFVRTSAGRSWVQILVSMYLLYFVLCILVFCAFYLLYFVFCILVFCALYLWSLILSWEFSKQTGPTININFWMALKTEWPKVNFWLNNIEFSKDSVLVGALIVDPAVLSTRMTFFWYRPKITWS